jgi:hypothetical protein
MLRNETLRDLAIHFFFLEPVLRSFDNMRANSVSSYSLVPLLLSGFFAGLDIHPAHAPLEQRLAAVDVVGGAGISLELVVLDAEVSLLATQCLEEH